MDTPTVESPALERMEQRPLISGPAHRALFRAYGQRGEPFFSLYEDVRLAQGGKPPPAGGFVAVFRSASRLIHQALATEDARNRLGELTPDIRILLARLDAGHLTITTFRQLAPLLADAVRTVAADHDVYLFGLSKGMIGWTYFRLMSAREQKLERLRLQDPEMHETITHSRDVVRDIERQVEREVKDSGLIPGRKELLGRPVTTGTDPVTGEEYVFDTDGDILTVPDYIEKRRKGLEKRRRMDKVFPNVNDLRTMPDEDIEGLTLGNTEYLALTDDKSGSRGVTRVYPVKKTLDGEMVVVDGRFKGVMFDDLVNRAGRMVEGVAYDMDPRKGVPVPLEVKNPDGTPDLRVTREPYATVTRGSLLFVRIPGGHGYTVARNAMRILSREVPTVRYVEKSRQSAYTFKPKDFAAVREAMGGMALSSAASKLLQAYFTDIAKHDLAIKAENLKHYDASKIGGFKQGTRLYTKQKEAMAWMESRGQSGVCALDTGLGKCVTGDTLVVTGNGMIPIRELGPSGLPPDTAVRVSGLSIVTEGQTFSISQFYYAGYKPTIRIRTRRGFEIEGSLIHPILIQTENGPVFRRLSDVVKGDYVSIDRNGSGFPTEDPILRVPEGEMFPNRMDPDLARLLAYIVAEGWTGEKNMFPLSQGPILNPEVHADIDTLLREKLGWDKEPVPDLKGSDSNMFRVCRKAHQMYLEWLGVDYVGSAEKIIPPAILRSRRETVREFLRGFIDAEGSVSDNVLEVSTASERLGRELQILLLRFGIVSSRTPRHVAGRVYWRLSLCGDDLRHYATEIGFVSKRKRELAATTCDRKSNPNLDIIPHMISLVEALRSDISDIAAGQNKGGGIYRRYGPSFTHTLTHIRKGRRNPTYPFLQRMIAIFDENGGENTPARQNIATIHQRHLFYDPIISIEKGFAEVMDVEVDDPRHCFTGNGIVNHNTAIALASMQKMLRDGMLGGEGRFLYVCPSALRGNLAKEAAQHLSHPKALMSRVDVMTYRQFTIARQNDPAFGTDYMAVFFDEAQEMKNPTSATSRAALSLNHPRKMLFTASPMERSPMEVLTLVSIASNHNINTPKGREEQRAFRKHFALEIGGKIVGIKKDPTTARDFRVWVKQHLYFADKQDVEEIALPQLRRQVTTLAMDPQVEAAYKEAAAGIKDILAGMVAKYRDRSPDANDPAIESARIRLAKQFRRLHMLANFPEREITGTDDPKMEQAAEIITERIGALGRALLFTDDPDLADKAAQTLSVKLPVRLHAECLSNEIRIWQDGGIVNKYGKRVYTDNDGKKWNPGDWKTYVLSRVISPNPDVLSCTLTSTYALGQNLQAFDTVIHLDRDAWNSETMKQRTARAWRAGQQNSVEEFILDAVYANPEDDLDATLDQVMGYLQQMEADLFDQVVIESQAEALGKEWFGMRRMDASIVEMARRLAALATSPYAARIGEVQISGSPA